MMSSVLQLDSDAPAFVRITHLYMIYIVLHFPSVFSSSKGIVQGEKNQEKKIS